MEVLWMQPSPNLGWKKRGNQNESHVIAQEKVLVCFCMFLLFSTIRLVVLVDFDFVAEPVGSFQCHWAGSSVIISTSCTNPEQMQASIGKLNSSAIIYPIGSMVLEYLPTLGLF